MPRARKTSYQRAVERVLKSPAVQLIESEFGTTPELIYAFRVMAAHISAEVRDRGGRFKKFALHEYAVAWAVAHNQKLARENKTVTSLRSPWLKPLETAGLLKIVGNDSGGFLRVDFEPLAARVQPLLNKIPEEAPKHVARAIEEQEKRNKRVEEAAERSKSIPPIFLPRAT